MRSEGTKAEYYEQILLVRHVGLGFDGFRLGRTAFAFAVVVRCGDLSATFDKDVPLIDILATIRKEIIMWSLHTLSASFREKLLSQ